MFADPQPGDVLAGKYSVERVLGRGGMGVVLAAQHLQLEERVAIKLMLPEVATNGEAVARFVREARAAAKIKSEHVARVSDVGTLDGGVPYMVMECLEGADLGALLSTRGRLPVEEVAEYVLQACEAIAEAHALGIVHRDLKPSNLYLTHRRDGTPVIKVLDFGISKVSGDAREKSDGALTRTSALMGSPLYMSPEQMTSSRDVDARTDIWSLGVVMYELLSGAPPFTAPTLPQMCALILEGALPPLRTQVPEVPEGVEAIVGRCLTRDLGRRFATVAELAVALAPFAPRRARVSVDRISAALGAVSAPAPSSERELPAAAKAGSGTAAAWADTAVPAPQRRGRFWVLVAAVLAAGAAGAVFLLARTEENPASPPDRPLAGAATPAVPEAAIPPTPEAPVPAIVPAPLPPATATTPPPVALPEAAPSTRAAPRKAPPRAAAAKVPPRPAPSPSVVKAKPNCNPNFVLDAQGEKHFKPECF
jgi:serine/threonine-protein kinase